MKSYRCEGCQGEISDAELRVCPNCHHMLCAHCSSECGEVCPYCCSELNYLQGADGRLKTLLNYENTQRKK